MVSIWFSSGVTFNYLHSNFVSFAGIMSTVISQQQLPKEDEEEEDEEQGEEFSFEDSADEDKLQGDSKVIPSDSVKAVQSKKEKSDTSGSVSQTGTDCTQRPPPAGQEGIITKDVVSISTAGNIFSEIIYFKLVLYWS